MVIQNYSYALMPEYIRRMLTAVREENSAALQENAWLALASLAATCTFMYAMRNSMIGASRWVEYRFRADIYKKLVHLPLSFYRKEQTGDLASRLVNDINDVRTLAGPGIMYVPNSLSRIAFFLPVMAQLNATLLAAIGGLMAMLMAMMIVVMPRLRPLYKRIQEERSQINNEAWQMVSGINTVKLQSMEASKLTQFSVQAESYVHANLRLAIVEQLTWPFFVLVFSLSAVVLLVFGGKAIINGDMTVEELLQFNIMLGVMAFPIFSLGWIMSLLQQGISALERIGRIFKNTVADEGRSEVLQGNETSIRVKNISLHDENKNEVLKNVSLNVGHGEIIGITGKTGCGKTVLLECILGLITPEKGSVTVNNIPVEKITMESLYEKISFVPQETFLFSDSIKNNIGFEEAGNLNFKRIVYSAEISDIAKDISSFPKKYEEVVGERGVTLSGGQRQRTSISRAIYKPNANVIILDDALSSVDSETEEQIIENLKTLKRKKTVILISHKISLLKVADKVHYLEKGRIAESGSHSELVAKGGAYATAAKLQELRRSIET